MKKNNISNCNLCGLCNDSSVLFKVSLGRETFGPRFQIKQLQDGVFSKLLYMNVGGDFVERVCPNGVMVDFIAKREELVKRGMTTPVVQRLIDNFRQFRDPYYDW